MGLLSNKSVAIYYDGNYISKVAKYYATNNIMGYRFNVSILHNYIVKSVEKLALGVGCGAYIAESVSFSSRRSTDKMIQRKNLIYWERINLDNLYTANIKYEPIISSFNGAADDAAVCSALSLRVYDRVVSDCPDIVVIIAGSGAYMHIVELLKQRGVDVMVVGWDILRVDDAEHEANCYEGLIAISNHAIIVNTVLDDTPEELAGLLIEMGAPVVSREEAKETDNDSDNNIALGDWGVSEIVNIKHNFGFIKGEPSNIFFHEVDFNGNFGELNIGDGVEFLLTKSDDGQILARNVSLVGSNLHLFEDNSQYSVDEEFFDWEN